MLLTKIAWTLLLALVLLLPLASISSKIEERSARAQDVARELAETGVGEQRLLGPVVVRRCSERYQEAGEDTAGRPVTHIRQRDCSERYVLDVARLQGQLATEVRTRGIYRTLFYTADLTLDGELRLPPLAQPGTDVVERRYGDTELRLGIADVRGIGGQSALHWNGTRVALRPGSNDTLLGRGLHARIASAAVGPQRIRLHLPLRGTREFAVVPLARNTEVALRGAWPHPSFRGRFLPSERTVSETGFAARWSISELASDAVRAYFACGTGPCTALEQEVIGVALLEPVDIYLQSMRAVDYGFLFVGLTFLVFMLIELTASLRLHPMHYALVGLALATFFLLLFALAEHLAFIVAYAIAAVACVALIGAYVTTVLGGARRAVTFCAYLLGTFGALYLLLRSEDTALLLGALLVFAVLATTMLLTRRVDWHALVAAGIARARPSDTFE